MNFFFRLKNFFMIKTNQTHFWSKKFKTMPVSIRTIITFTTIWYLYDLFHIPFNHNWNYHITPQIIHFCPKFVLPFSLSIKKTKFLPYPTSISIHWLLFRFILFVNVYNYELLYGNPIYSRQIKAQFLNFLILPLHWYVP